MGPGGPARRARPGRARGGAGGAGGGAARSRADLGAAVALGACSGLLTLAFFEAIARIPLGVAVTIEFLGPLGVALAGSRRAPAGGRGRVPGGGAPLPPPGA